MASELARPSSPPAAARPNSLAGLWLADLTVRSAYQMGKSPLLPILAAGLGASDAYLGVIVSISTLTGMVLKPLVGILSDRWGRRGWLLLGTAFFAITPFLYRFVETPAQLLLLRLVHGSATAIYGPVTLAYVAGQSRARLAERMGWFGLARSGGNILGPAAAGWLLLTLEPAKVFTLIGLVSSLAFLPILQLPSVPTTPSASRPPLTTHMRRALAAAARSPGLWLAGGLEFISYVLLYAVKAFLPLYALDAGTSIAVVGGLFALQELVAMLLKPAGGRLADRAGYLPGVAAGMLLLGAGGGLLAVTAGAAGLLVVALLLGAGQALIFPAVLAWLAAGTLDGVEAATGSALGLLGALRNSGKVAGPVLGGLLIARAGYATTFLLLGGALLAGALGMLPALIHPAWRAKISPGGQANSGPGLDAADTTG